MRRIYAVLGIPRLSEDDKAIITASDRKALMMEASELLHLAGIRRGA